MKKLYAVLIAGALMATSAVASAQEPQPRPQGEGQGRPNLMGMLMQGITLSADQQVQVDAIVKKYTDERAALRSDQSLDMDGRRAKSRELMTKQSDEIKAVLTDEQKKTFEKNQADMQARMQGGGRPPQR